MEKVDESVSRYGHFRTFSPAGLVLARYAGVHRTIRIYKGRLPNRHIWRHLLLAASTARTSMGARAVTASAGSGRSCCLLRWHPITVVGTGRHHRFGSGATVAPLWHPLPLLPNPLQCLSELTLAQGSCQFPLPDGAADPPDLKTTEDQGNQTQLEVSPVQVLPFAPFCSCTQIRSNVCLNWLMLGVGAFRWGFSALPNFKTFRARANAKTAQGTRIQRGLVISEFGCRGGHFGTMGGSWGSWGARGKGRQPFICAGLGSSRTKRHLNRLHIDSQVSHSLNFRVKRIPKTLGAQSFSGNRTCNCVSVMVTTFTASLQVGH